MMCRSSSFSYAFLPGLPFRLFFVCAFLDSSRDGLAEVDGAAGLFLAPNISLRIMPLSRRVL